MPAPTASPARAREHRRRHAAAAGGLRAAGPQIGREVAERLAGEGRHDGGALVRCEVGDAEGGGGAGRGLARHGGPGRAVEAGGPGDVRGPADGGPDVALREGVRRVDDVVVHLGGAVTDVVDEVGELVPHDVPRGARHRLGRAADADLAEGSEVLDDDVGGCPRGRADLDPGQLVVPVLALAVLVAGPHAHVAVDAVPLLPLGEAPGDVLGDDDGAVLLGLDARVEHVRLLLGREGRRHRGAPSAQGGGRLLGGCRRRAEQAERGRRGRPGPSGPPGPCRPPPASQASPRRRAAMARSASRRSWRSRSECRLS